MMKLLSFIAGLVLVSGWGPAASGQTLHIGARKTHRISDQDSTGVLKLDTLIMDRRAHLVLENKKSFSIEAISIFVDEKAVISAHDSRNNGTDLTLSGKFVELGSLALNVAGREFDQGANRKAGNGNGGDVLIRYAPEGIRPQLENHRDQHYIGVLNRGAGRARTPQVEIANVWTQIRMGAGTGRPGGRAGKVYDASEGKDGKTELKRL